MTEKLEYDWPPTMRHHRRPRVEVIEPEEQPTQARVKITVRHHRRAPPRFLPVFLVLVGLLMLWKYPLGSLMLAALGGWPLLIGLLIGVGIVAAAAWRERRAGRPF
jgi:hypothetical protein